MIVVIQQHPWVLARPGAVILVLCLLMVAFVAYFGASWLSSWAIFILIVFSVSYGYYYWFLWASGKCILTSQRVISLDQKSLFHRTISETELDRIQDVTCETHGFLNTSMSIGDVRIQTASSEKIIVLKRIYNPYDFQQQIMLAAGKKED